MAPFTFVSGRGAAGSTLRGPSESLAPTPRSRRPSSTLPTRPTSTRSSPTPRSPTAAHDERRGRRRPAPRPTPWTRPAARPSTLPEDECESPFRW